MTRKFSYLLLIALLTAVSCTKESVGNDIRVVCEEWDTAASRTVLTDPAIENKVSGVTLAAYSNGRLFCSAWFPSGTGPLELELSEGVRYELYALANIPDMRDELPAEEDDLGTLEWRLSSYGDVNNSGIPMGGRVSCTGGSSGTTVITLKRMFAKVIAHLSCDYPDAIVEKVKICGLNSRLLPFGQSRAGSEADMMSGCDQSSGTAGEGVFVLYVPENLQGSIGAATVSERKNPDTDPAIRAAHGRLTYLETQVRMKDSNNQYSGTVTYRTYAGNNSSDNFDIEGNCVYDWYITFYEDKLQRNDWKTDTGSLSDKRFISLRSPYFVLPGENIALSSIVESNIGLENLVPELDDIDGICSGSALQDVAAGYISIDSKAAPGEKARVRVRPRFNAGDHIGQGDIVAYEQELLFGENTLNLNTGDAAEGILDVLYRHLYGKYKSPERLLGLRNEVWNHSVNNGMIQATYDDSSDRITYKLNPKIAPGTYHAHIASTNGRKADSAVISVSDTRYMCTDGKDPVHPAYGSYNRVTSMKKSRINQSSTWKIGYNWGQFNAGQYRQYWKFGESIYGSWEDNIVCEVEGLKEAFLKQGFDYPFTSTFHVMPEIPKGEYKFVVYWKDAPSIRDSAILKILGTDVESISVTPSSVKLLKGQSLTFSATVSPSDADCTDVLWESDSECISISSDGTAEVIRHGAATVTARPADGSEAFGQAGIEAGELQVRPSSQAVFLGSDISFSAVITRADGSEVDVTSSCKWSTDNGDIATSLTGGSFRSKSCGTTSVSAQYDGSYGKAESSGSLSVSEQPSVKKYRIQLFPESGTVVREGEKIKPEVRLFTDIWTGDILTHTDTVGELISNTSVEWSTPDGGAHASISADGTAEAIAAGEETIRACLKSDVTVSTLWKLLIDCRLDVGNGNWGSNKNGGDNY